MHLLYLDEAGAPGDRSQNYFVLAGVCLFERQGWWVSQEMEKIAAKVDPADPDSVELHGSPMLTGRRMWRKVAAQTRGQLLQEALTAFANSNRQNRLFAVAVNKSSLSKIGKDPVEYAFMQLCSRFDLFLKRIHHSGNPDQKGQRGMILLDKTNKEHRLQGLARDFRRVGHDWGVLANLAEVPVFLDSRASRLIQLADLVAYATFRHFEHNDSRFFNVIAHRFDSEGGVQHGLHHKDS